MEWPWVGLGHCKKMSSKTYLRPLALLFIFISDNKHIVFYSGEWLVLRGHLSVTFPTAVLTNTTSREFWPDTTEAFVPWFWRLEVRNQGSQGRFLLEDPEENLQAVLGDPWLLNTPSFSALVVRQHFSLGVCVCVYGFSGFWPHVGCRLPNQGSNPCSLQWKHGTLSTGPPGNSRISLL